MTHAGDARAGARTPQEAAGSPTAQSRTAAQGRTAAVGVPFQHIVAAHGTSVLRVCRAMVGPVDAEDAWSETFLSALRAYPSLSADADPEAWLVTIAQRKCVDLLRTRARSPMPVAELPQRTGNLGVPGAGDRFAPLWSALARLPFVQRSAIVCHHLAGMPYAKAAELIGNSPAAARRAAADGIATLRRDPALARVPPAQDAGAVSTPRAARSPAPRDLRGAAR